MPTETWQHGFAHTNGLRLHYVEQGEGPLMILLHGFPEFWYSWRYQIPVLNQHFHVVAPDLRGYSDSDKPEGVEQYQLPSLVKDVRGLLHCFGQQKAIIVGHDWGAAVAWTFAAKHPEATERLIVCSIPHLGVFRKMAGQSFVEHYPALQRLFYIFFFRVPEVPERFFSKDNYAFFDAYRLINPNRFTPEVIAEYKKAIGKPGALTAGLNYYRANLPAEVLVGEVPLLEEKVTRPTLFMYGENEQFVSRSVAEWTREFVEAPFTFRPIPQCGHCVQQEEPEVVNQAIMEFLADLKGD
ncbi:MAG TPA: alpha/beta hydrolase [Candidatus Binatia bacterium]|nr:alpha/beta hydrolase [Candidatus Binatia bacterium]